MIGQERSGKVGKDHPWKCAEIKGVLGRTTEYGVQTQRRQTRGRGDFGSSHGLIVSAITSKYRRVGTVVLGESRLDGQTLAPRCSTLNELIWPHNSHIPHSITSKTPSSAGS